MKLNKRDLHVQGTEDSWQTNIYVSQQQQVDKQRIFSVCSHWHSSMCCLEALWARHYLKMLPRKVW